ncbi:MAG: metalloprotease [Fervidicoccaceae archaeon]
MWRAAALLDAINEREPLALATAAAALTLALLTKFGAVGVASVLAGFVAHELAHRAISRRYGCSSRFVVDSFGLLVTLISALLPVAFLAPGYVSSRCPFTLSKFAEARIAASGPLANIALAVAALAVHTILGDWPLRVFAEVNAWLALFNLLPIGPLDGSKVLRGSVVLWAAAFIASLLILWKA